MKRTFKIFFSANFITSLIIFFQASLVASHLGKAANDLQLIQNDLLCLNFA
jgi:hypothetical protein